MPSFQDILAKMTGQAETLAALDQKVSALSAVQSERDSLRADLDKSKTTLSGLTAERDALSAKVATLETDNAAMKANVAEADTKAANIDAEIDKKASAKALAIVQQQGGKALAIGDGGAIRSADANMKRSDFDALTPRAKTQFIRSGGRLQD